MKIAIIFSCIRVFVCLLCTCMHSPFNYYFDIYLIWSRHFVHSVIRLPCKECSRENPKKTNIRTLIYFMHICKSPSISVTLEQYFIISSSYFKLQFLALSAYLQCIELFWFALVPIITQIFLCHRLFEVRFDKSRIKSLMLWFSKAFWSFHNSSFSNE